MNYLTGSSLAYSLNEFLEDSEAVVRNHSAESETLLHLKPILERLIQTPNSVPSESFAPRQDRFAMNLLHMPKDKAYSVIAGVWMPGQTTPIHDHLT